MPQDKSKVVQAGEGFKTLQKMVADANEKNKKAPKKPEPPAVDTGSVGGLLRSLKNRASYAIFGAPEEKK